MPRAPRGKRVKGSGGGFTVAAKNSNGDGSVFYEPPTARTDGRERAGRWRATYRDEHGRVRRVTAATRADAERRRDERLAEIAMRVPSSSRFSRETTVAELVTWWLESIARHQVKASTFDSYRQFGRKISTAIGDLAVVDVTPETLVEWQSNQLDRYAPLTVLNCRKVGRQAFAEAVKLGLIPANPFDVVKAPRAKRMKPGRALSPGDAKAVILAAQSYRYGAAVTLLFCQGWRVSEVLGLAWDDIDLDAGTAHIRRGVSYSPSTGLALGTTKTSGAEGIHFLAPASVEHLRRHQKQQDEERALVGDTWPAHTCDGETVSIVFTTAAGGIATRSAIVKTIERAASVTGIDPTGLATHAGRRTVVTALYAHGGLDLADIARHVGHVDMATTAGYVRSLGNRPRDTALRAAQLLDPTLDG